MIRVCCLDSAVITVIWVVLGLCLKARSLEVASDLVCLEPGEASNLVDSASSHTLVSKTKPCTSKYKSPTLKLRMAHYISYSLFDSPLLLG